MKKLLLLTGLAILLSANTSFAKEKGNQIRVAAGTHYITQQVEGLEPFDRIIVNLDAELEYRPTEDGTTSLTIELPDNVWEYLDVTNERGTLRIEYRKGVTVDGADLKITAGSPNLDGITASGACDANILGRVVCENFYLRVSGISTLKMEAIDCRSLDANISGGGNVTIDQIVANVAEVTTSGQGTVTLYGQAPIASFDVSGAREIKAEQMKTQNLAVKVSGSGTLRCNVYNSIMGSVSGMGKLYYSGSPSQVEITGRTSAVWQM